MSKKVSHKIDEDLSWKRAYTFTHLTPHKLILVLSISSGNIYANVTFIYNFFLLLRFFLYSRMSKNIHAYHYKCIRIIITLFLWMLHRMRTSFWLCGKEDAMMMIKILTNLSFNSRHMFSFYFISFLFVYGFVIYNGIGNALYLPSRIFHVSCWL